MNTQIYDNDPHQTIAGTNNFQVEGSSVDLEATLQFTSTTGSAYFDFSAYVDTSEPADKERQKIYDEIAAFKRLHETVTEQFSQFLAHATSALGALEAASV